MKQENSTIIIGADFCQSKLEIVMIEISFQLFRTQPKAVPEKWDFSSLHSKERLKALE